MAEVVNRRDIALGEVVLVYVKAVDSAYAARGGKLCGFARVALDARTKALTRKETKIFYIKK